MNFHFIYKAHYKHIKKLFARKFICLTLHTFFKSFLIFFFFPLAMLSRDDLYRCEEYWNELLNMMRSFCLFTLLKYSNCNTIYRFLCPPFFTSPPKSCLPNINEKSYLHPRCGGDGRYFLPLHHESYNRALIIPSQMKWLFIRLTSH